MQVHSNPAAIIANITTATAARKGGGCSFVPAGKIFLHSSF